MMSKTAVFEKVRISVLVLPLTLALMPMLLPWQWLSGPMVNFMLVLSFYLIGYRGAIVLSMIPSLAAMAGGIFPYPLWILAPFVILSNMTMVSGFYLLKRTGRSENVMLFSFGPSLLKALFLIVCVSFISLYLSPSLTQMARMIFAWPQFFTAASGSFLAYLYLRRYTASL